jgi:hypothetical protein
MRLGGLLAMELAATGFSNIQRLVLVKPVDEGMKNDEVASVTSAWLLGIAQEF